MSEEKRSEIASVKGASSVSAGEEKRNRITAAITVNAIILIFIIVAVILYQVVTISLLKKRKHELYEELFTIRRQYEGAEDILERLKSDDRYLEILIALAQMGEDVSEYDPGTT